MHSFYNQLRDNEKRFVDDTFDAPLFKRARTRGILLAGDDRIERAVEALARAVVESRTSSNRPGDMAAEYAAKTGVDYATALVHCNMD